MPDPRTTRATTTEVGHAARPLGRVLGTETMRVYLGTLPWVWLSVAVAASMTWQTVGVSDVRADHYQSLQATVSAGQNGYVPQLSPSGEGSE